MSFLTILFWWAFWSMAIMFGMVFLGGFITFVGAVLACVAWMFKWLRNYWEPYDRL